MAIQKLSSYDPIQSLTQSLTTGLSGGLQALAQHKTNQLQQRNLASALERLGLPQELGNINPQLQQQLIPKLAQNVAKQPQLEAKQQAAIDKETLPIYKQTLKEERSARETKQTLDKMQKLIEKGDLPPAALYKFVKDIQENVPSTVGALAGGYLGSAGGPIGAAVGAGLGAMINPVASLVESGIKRTYRDTEQFEKLSNSFIRGAKEIFGSRITDADLKAFLATVPTLTQTDNGKKQIIENMRSITDAAEVRGKVMREIIEENGRKRPANLEILIEEKAGEELDKIAQKFINNVGNDEQIVSSSNGGSISEFLKGDIRKRR